VSLSTILTVHCNGPSRETTFYFHVYFQLSVIAASRSPLSPANARAHIPCRSARSLLFRARARIARSLMSATCDLSQARTRPRKSTEPAQARSSDHTALRCDTRACVCVFSLVRHTLSPVRAKTHIRSHTHAKRSPDSFTATPLTRRRPHTKEYTAFAVSPSPAK
jgi:hypothetical protein